MGQIYIIKNLINDKVYIGQTIQPLKRRFACHILHSSIDSIHTKLHTAMRELGSDNFYIESILKCKNSELNKFEIEYIKKYDSYHNGYNSTSGGSGIKHDKIYDEYINEFIDDYYRMTLCELCIKYKISESLVYSVINVAGVDKKINYTIKKANKAITVIMYDIEFNPVQVYNTISSAIEQLNINKQNGYGRIKVACQNGNIAYGHRWQLASDLVYDDKIFRTKFDKEAYIQGKPAYQPEGKQYYIVDGALDTIFKQYPNSIKQQNKCIDCGKNISKHSVRCKECYNKYSTTEEFYTNKSNYSSKCPDIDTLRNLLSEYNYTQIGKMYNVSANAVKKWALKYDLLKEKKEKPSKEELENLLRAYSTKQVAEMYNVHHGTVNWWASNYNIERTKFDRVKCIELDLVFNSKSEAARYLIENKLTTRTDIHNLAYAIGVSIDTKSKCQGFNWIYIDK